MSDFEFDLDIEAELAGIRGHKEKPAKQTRRETPEPVKTEPKKVIEEQRLKSEHGASETGSPSDRPSEPQEPVLDHSHGGEDATSSNPVVNADDAKIDKKGAPSPVEWKKFKTLPGIFEHVGGERPVRLNPDIRRSQVSGFPEPMIMVIQSLLSEKHVGAVISFPWGEYEITEKNRVLTTKSSLVRYLMFDALRDASGAHVQYAKQWMVLHHPVFDEGFSPETHLGPNNDELDIYALLFVAHMSEDYHDSRTTSSSEQDYQTAERIGMLNMSMGRMLDKLNAQEEMFRAYAERNTMMQTVILLDRMGLLNGGLPRDVGEFVNVLEENRETLVSANRTVADHIEGEKERKKMLARQERLRQMQQRGAR